MQFFRDVPGKITDVHLKPNFGFVSFDTEQVRALPGYLRHDSYLQAAEEALRLDGKDFFGQP